MNPDSQVTIGDEELRTLNAYWRAANYLAVGMIYLRANPLLREPLSACLRPCKHAANVQRNTLRPSAGTGGWRFGTGEPVTPNFGNPPIESAFPLILASTGTRYNPANI